MTYVSTYSRHKKGRSNIIQNTIGTHTKVNKEMRKAKSECYVNKINYCSNTRGIKKSWSLINSLLGKKEKSTYINEQNVDNTSGTDPKLIAEYLNDYFVNIGLDLAMDCSSQGETNNESEGNGNKKFNCLI